jgi:hypothetical protein
MKTIKELLELTLTELEKNLGMCEFNRYAGICDVIKEIRPKVSKDDYSTLHHYIREELTGKVNLKFRYFINCVDGQEISGNQSQPGGFVWKQYDAEPRIKWLKEQIKLNS